MIPADPTCHSCAQARLYEVAAFPRLPRVTSDSKPFRAGGRLFVCEACGLVQKIADARWLQETGEIYRDYQMHHQSGSADQPVFINGRITGRCEELCRRLAASGRLPAAGTMLDVGPGAGAMLAAFSAAFPRWRLFGLDLDARREDTLRAIPRFERLFTGSAENLAERFELITLIHSLEHFSEPLAMLKTLRGRLSPGGRLFVEVQDVERTPFDLVVADHLCHFTPASLAALVAHAGFTVESLEERWINKELSLLAASAGESTISDADGTKAVANVEGAVAWLNRVLDDARTEAATSNFGIFGTSIAATWLAAGLDDKVRFFVDEDPDRQSRQHLGRPVLSPAHAPAGSVVYLAFPPPVARAIRERLAHLPVRFALPE